MTSSEPPATHRYALRFMPEALVEWHQLDGSVRAPLKKLLAKREDGAVCGAATARRRPSGG